MLKIKFEIRFLAVGSRKWSENDRKLAKMAEFCRKMAKKGVGQDHNLNRCSCGMLVSWRIIILELILEHSKNLKIFEKSKKWKKSLIPFFLKTNQFWKKEYQFKIQLNIISNYNNFIEFDYIMIHYFHNLKWFNEIIEIMITELWMNMPLCIWKLCCRSKIAKKLLENSEIVVILTNLTLQGQNLNVSSIFLNYFNNLIFIRFVFYIPAYGQ